MVGAVRGAFSLNIKFQCLEGGTQWVLSNVYGPNNGADKEEFWGELAAVGGGWWSLPWCLGGDFNATVTSADRQNGKVIPCQAKCFQSLLDCFDLLTLDLVNGKFTHRSTHNTVSRLDRFIVSVDWLEIFGQHSEKVGPFAKSDHKMLILHGPSLVSGPKPFRFELFWMEIPLLLKLMAEWWKEPDIRGKPGYVLACKLKHLKARVSEWVKSNLGKVEDRTRAVQEVLNNLEAKEESCGLSLEEQNLKRCTEKEMSAALVDEFIFWSSRVKKPWSLHDDRCSKLFHRAVNQQQSNNNIRELVIDGRVCSDAGEIRSHINNFYRTLFS